MSIIRKIQGREALPVWTLPYATRWRESPDSLVRVLTELDGFPLRHGLVAYKFISEKNEAVAYHPGEWEIYVHEFKALEDKLRAEEVTPNANLERWKIEAVKKLPGNAFVWHDEFAAWFKGTRPYCRGVSVIGEQVRITPHLKDFDKLTLEPDIPGEVCSHFAESEVIPETNEPQRRWTRELVPGADEQAPVLEPSEESRLPRQRKPREPERRMEWMRKWLDNEKSLDENFSSLDITCMTQAEVWTALGRLSGDLKLFKPLKVSNVVDGTAKKFFAACRAAGLCHFRQGPK